MAVIIREEREIGGAKFGDVKVFQSDKRILTKSDRDQAEKLDAYLHDKMLVIASEARKKGLLKLKSKSGVLALWHFVGQELAFVDDCQIVPPEDRKFIWRALWDHAGELAPGEKERRSRKAGTTRDHWRYCYLVHKKSRGSLEYAERAGNWRAWVEFIDRVETRNDERFLDWLEKKMGSTPKKGWLRTLTKGIHKSFNKLYTSVFTQEELEERLEQVWNESLGSA
jgi:hypothetical protein